MGESNVEHLNSGKDCDGQRLTPRVAWVKIKELTAGPRDSIIRHAPQLKFNVDQTIGKSSRQASTVEEN